MANKTTLKNYLGLIQQRGFPAARWSIHAPGDGHNYYTLDLGLQGRDRAAQRQFCGASEAETYAMGFLDALDALDVREEANHDQSATV